MEKRTIRKLERIADEIESLVGMTNRPISENLLSALTHMQLALVHALKEFRLGASDAK